MPRNQIVGAQGGGLLGFGKCVYRNAEALYLRAQLRLLHKLRVTYMQAKAARSLAGVKTGVQDQRQPVCLADQLRLCGQSKVILRRQFFSA